jgi:hypothetical protein
LAGPPAGDSGDVDIAEPSHFHEMPTRAPRLLALP